MTADTHETRKQVLKNVVLMEVNGGPSRKRIDGIVRENKDGLKNMLSNDIKYYEEMMFANKTHDDK
jgi:hypothetical protein